MWDVPVTWVSSALKVATLASFGIVLLEQALTSTTVLDHLPIYHPRILLLYQTYFLLLIQPHLLGPGKGEILHKVWHCLCPLLTPRSPPILDFFMLTSRTSVGIVTQRTLRAAQGFSVCIWSADLGNRSLHLDIADATLLEALHGR